MAALGPAKQTMNSNTEGRLRDEHGLRAAWYDFRAWWHTRRAVLADPALALQGPSALPFSARGFAGFAWVILPAGLLSSLAMLAAVLVEMPESAFDLTAATLAETRAQVAPDDALRRTAGVDVPPDAASWEAARDQASGAMRVFVRRSLRSALTLDGPQVDGEARAKAQAEIVAIAAELAQPLAPLARYEFQRRVERRFLVMEKKLRFLKRWNESGAGNAVGMLFVGLVMLAMGRSFRFMMRRRGPRFVHAAQADEVFHYYVIARTAPYLAGTVGGMIVVQLSLWYQFPLALLLGMAAAMVFSLLMVVGFYRSGATVAAVLIGDPPEPRERRAVSWRLVWVFLLLQLAAALWGGLFAYGTGLYFRYFA